MTYTIGFGDGERATAVASVGGKGANLGHLTAAGFDVPPGFTVATAAYVAFLDEAGIGDRVLGAAEAFAYEDAARLEEQTAEVRDLIETAQMPGALAAAIVDGYARLGDEPHVAVRSSGTAEDTAAASFAGLHDTYLDIRGGDEVVRAVQRCWASMWSARAASYRHQQGFAHADALIAVVVQAMIEPSVSGVMFTANPLGGQTNEIVVNASWGLGESIVSGIVIPDEFTLDIDTLHVKRSAVGTKEIQIVRAADGRGTVTERVDPAEQTRPCLTGEELAELGDLGRRITRHYGGLPQDVEWAYADGAFFVLQARPVTGVALTWDDHLEDWQTVREHDDETVWTTKWADEFWTGAITPLFYTVRGKEFLNIIHRFNRLCGFDELNASQHFKYRRGTAYYNVGVDREMFTWIIPPALRMGSLGYLPDSWKEEVCAVPLDRRRFAKMMLRVNTLHPEKRPHRWHATVRQGFIEGRVEEADGPTVEQLRAMSDRQVRQQLQASEDLAEAFMDELWSGIFITTHWAMGLFVHMLMTWYDGDNPMVLQDLISGLGEPTLMTDESHGMWRLADRLRSSPELTEAFRRHEGAAFFDAVADVDGDWARDYAAFVQAHGHRGQADRDIIFDRRAENPGLDYESLKALLSVTDPVPPWETERTVVERRKQVAADVEANLAAQPFGKLKAQAFRAVYDHVISFLLLREDWRHYIDRVTLCKKRCFAELGARAVRRGLLEEADDHYFLGEPELMALLDGGRPTPLLRAKIAGRRQAFEAFRSGAEQPPMHLQGSVAIELDAAPDLPDGTFQGIGTAQGETTGRARIVPDLSQIGLVENGDILICYGTDPGWASVFGLVKGLVMEAGGMLAHGSCLSREYGIPAVVLRNATRLIEDGATITIDGATGQVTVEDQARVPA